MQPDWFKRLVKVTDFNSLLLLVLFLNGLLTCTRLLKLVYISPLSDTNHVTGIKSSSWVYCESRFQCCTAQNWNQEGIFCANLCVPVIGLPLFHRYWWTPCYQKRPGTIFFEYQGSDTDTLPRPNEDQMRRTERTKMMWQPHINIFLKNKNKNVRRVRKRRQTLQIWEGTISPWS